MSLHYQSGFGNHFSTEAEQGALPRNQNSPQKPPLGLYAEQLSGSAFTVSRHDNLRSWQYRLRPSVLHCGQATLVKDHLLRDQFNPDHVLTPPDQLRWNPLPLPTEATDFVSGLVTLAYHNGGATHLYACNHSMTDTFFYNADGDFLIVPQLGRLRFKTEMGVIDAKPSEIVVIQRGIRFQVECLDKEARGYICENQGAPFILPNRGPIGANGLAEERHFLTPVASYEDRSGDSTLLSKFRGQLWSMAIPHSPLDVVAWHGTYAPYKYDLEDFVPMFSARIDHADPSIFTVLTSPTTSPGTANIDLAIFPERWMVAEDTFRPPYYHRNIMSELMGLIYGQYDAKEEGFVPGGASLHNCMSGHGVDQQAFDKATHEDTHQPVRYRKTLAFMFESSDIWQLTDFALNGPLKQTEYLSCWQGLKKHYK